MFLLAFLSAFPDGRDKKSVYLEIYIYREGELSWVNCFNNHCILVEFCKKSSGSHLDATV